MWGLADLYRALAFTLSEMEATGGFVVESK